MIVKNELSLDSKGKGDIRSYTDKSFELKVKAEVSSGKADKVSGKVILPKVGARSVSSVSTATEGRKRSIFEMIDEVRDGDTEKDSEGG